MGNFGKTYEADESPVIDHEQGLVRVLLQPIEGCFNRFRFANRLESAMHDVADASLNAVGKPARQIPAGEQTDDLPVLKNREVGL